MRRVAALVAVCTAVVALSGCIPGPPPAGSWHFESLDGPGTGAPTGGRLNANTGYAKAVLQYGDTIHVFYAQDFDIALRHAWWTGAAWQFETIEGSLAHNLGGGVSAVLYGGVPHLFYFDGSYADLRHAWLSPAGTWWTETLDGNVADAAGRVSAQVGRRTATVVYGGAPHVFYGQEGLAGRLRHAWWNGLEWRFETLDGATGIAMGAVNSSVAAGSAEQSLSATLYGGVPHAFYYDYGVSYLRHAWWTGSAWRAEDLDGDGVLPGTTTDRVGRDSAPIVDGAALHVFFWNEDTGAQRHGWYTPGLGWRFEVLDGPGSSGGTGLTGSGSGIDSAAVVWNGQLHVFSFSGTATQMRHAWWNGSVWSREWLDGPMSSYPGHSADLSGQENAAIVWNGQLHVFTQEAAGPVSRLRHVWYG